MAFLTGKKVKLSQIQKCKIITCLTSRGLEKSRRIKFYKLTFYTYLT
jgi:hypothetical protein